MIEKELMDCIAKAARVLLRYGAKEVYVFGSAAEGEMHAHSDVDLAVLGLPASSYYKAVGDALGALGMPLDLVKLEDDTALARHLLAKRERGELQRVA